MISASVLKFVTGTKDKNLERDARWLIDQTLVPHQRFAIQLSGGKDSLAVLYLLKPWWKKLVVLWSNLGDPYPETIAQMQKIAELVGEFHEVTGHSLSDAAAAFPVDMLTVRSTGFGRALEPDGAQITLQSRYDCCTKNFWEPMTKAVKELGITLLFRGQRTQEILRAPIKTGATDPSGAYICLPIDSWSKQDVIDYLKQNDVELPKFYDYLEASEDCMHCTAFANDQRGKLAYLRKFHPVVATEYERRMKLIGSELAHGVLEFQRSMAEVVGEATHNPLEH